MLAKSWINRSVSTYGAPLLFAKKETGELEVRIDYRALNANIKLEVFPLPRIADLLDR